MLIYDVALFKLSHDKVKKNKISNNLGLCLPFALERDNNY